MSHQGRTPPPILSQEPEPSQMSLAHPIPEGAPPDPAAPDQASLQPQLYDRQLLAAWHTLCVLAKRRTNSEDLQAPYVALKLLTQVARDSKKGAMMALDILSAAEGSEIAAFTGSLISFHLAMKGFEAMASIIPPPLASNDTQIAEAYLDLITTLLSTGAEETRLGFRKKLLAIWEVDMDLIHLIHSAQPLNIKAKAFAAITAFCLTPQTATTIFTEIGKNYLKRPVEKFYKMHHPLYLEFDQICSDLSNYKYIINILVFLNKALGLMSKTLATSEEEVLEFFYNLILHILRNISIIGTSDPTEKPELYHQAFTFFGYLARRPSLLEFLNEPENDIKNSGIINCFLSTPFFYDCINQCLSQYEYIADYNRYSDVEYMTAIMKAKEACIKLLIDIVHLSNNLHGQQLMETQQPLKIILNRSILTTLIFEDLENKSVQYQKLVIHLLSEFTAQDAEFLYLFSKKARENLLLNLGRILKATVENLENDRNNYDYFDMATAADDTRGTQLITLILDNVGKPQNNIAHELMGIIINDRGRVVNNIDVFLNNDGCSCTLLSQLHNKEFYTKCPLTYMEILKIFYTLSNSQYTEKVVAFSFYMYEERTYSVLALLGRLENITAKLLPVEPLDDNDSDSDDSGMEIDCEEIEQSLTFNKYDWYHSAYLLGFIRNIIINGDKSSQNRKKLVDNTTQMLFAAIGFPTGSGLTSWNLLDLLNHKCAKKSKESDKVTENILNHYSIITQKYPNTQLQHPSVYTNAPYTIMEEKDLIIYNIDKIQQHLWKQFNDVKLLVPREELPGFRDMYLAMVHLICTKSRDENTELHAQYAYDIALESILGLIQCTLGSCESLESNQISPEFLEAAAVRCYILNQEFPENPTLVKAQSILLECRDELLPAGKDDLEKIEKFGAIMEELKKNSCQRNWNKVEKMMHVMEEAFKSVSGQCYISMVMAAISESKILQLAAANDSLTAGFWNKYKVQCKALMAKALNIVFRIEDIVPEIAKKSHYWNKLLFDAKPNYFALLREIIFGAAQVSKEDLTLCAHIIRSISHLIKIGAIRLDEDILQDIKEMLNYPNQGYRHPLNVYQRLTTGSQSLQTKLENGLLEFITFVEAMAYFMDAVSKSGSDTQYLFDTLAQHWKNILYMVTREMDHIYREWSVLNQLGISKHLIADWQLQIFSDMLWYRNESVDTTSELATANDTVETLRSKSTNLENIMGRISAIISIFTASVNTICQSFESLDNRIDLNAEEEGTKTKMEDLLEYFITLKRSLSTSAHSLDVYGNLLWCELNTLEEKILNIIYIDPLLMAIT